MYKENELIKIIAVSILLLFSASVFSIMDHEYGSGKSASPSSISGNISNTDIAPAAQNISQNNSAGFVKYTIVLSNNTLINGNFINGQFANTSNGQIPFGVAFGSANGYIYITNMVSKVWVINGATNKVIANISVGKHPQEVAFDPSNGYIYVANAGSDTVSVISIPAIAKEYKAPFMESVLFIYITITIVILVVAIGAVIAMRRRKK